MGKKKVRASQTIRFSLLGLTLLPGVLPQTAKAGLLLPAVKKRTDSGSFISFNPFPSNPESAGVTIAAGDLDGDGYSDVIVGGGPGGGPHVLAFDRFAGSSHTVPAPRDLASGQSTGRSVAAGFVSNTSTSDVVVAAGENEPGIVQSFHWQPPFNGTPGTFVASDTIAPFGSDYTGGIRVAAGDLDGSTIDGGMIVAAAKKNYVGHVTLIKQRTDGSERIAYQFSPFAGEAGSDNIDVAVGNANYVTPHGTPFFAVSSIITAAGAGAGPHVKLFSVTGTPQTVGDPTYSVSLLQDLLPSSLGLGAGVDALSIATGDVNNDGTDDLIVSSHYAGPGGGPNVKYYDIQDVNGKLTVGSPTDVDLTGALSSIPLADQSNIFFNVAYSNLPVVGGETTGGLLLSPTAVPEPAAASMLSLPIVLAALHRRRRVL